MMIRVASPRRANLRAVAAPMPDVPPMTTSVLFSPKRRGLTLSRAALISRRCMLLSHAVIVSVEMGRKYHSGELCIKGSMLPRGKTLTTCAGEDGLCSAVGEECRTTFASGECEGSKTTDEGASPDGCCSHVRVIWAGCAGRMPHIRGFPAADAGAGRHAIVESICGGCAPS